MDNININRINDKEYLLAHAAGIRDHFMKLAANETTKEGTQSVLNMGEAFANVWDRRAASL